MTPLLDHRGIEVTTDPWVPSAAADGRRVVWYDGRRGYVSPDTFTWMRTATPAALGAMAVVSTPTFRDLRWMPPPFLLPKPADDDAVTIRVRHYGYFTS